MAKKSEKYSFDVLTEENFLEDNKFNIWDCYSEHKSNFNDRLHFHNFYELSVIYEGSSGFLVNGISFSMKERSIQLIRPSDYHRQQTGDGEHIRYYNIMFAPDFISRELAAELDGEYPLCADADDKEWDELIASVKRMYSEFKTAYDDPLSKIIIRNAVENICVFLIRSCRGGITDEESTIYEPIRRAVSYVQKNYRRALTLKAAAAEAGLSSAYFSTLFHEVMGTTFAAYLNDYRIQAAKRYLTSSGMTVKEIAYACGFSSYPHFVTVFKRNTGLTPGSFREKDNVNK